VNPQEVLQTRDIILNQINFNLLKTQQNMKRVCRSKAEIFGIPRRGYGLGKTAII